MDPKEEFYALAPQSEWKWNKKPNEKRKLKGPFRVIRLCLLAVMLPGILIAVPLYLRYRVYSEHLVPLGMSDMRLVDNKISTTWCQRQLVTSNATFNAYLLSQKPNIQMKPKFVNITREMVLEDDTKEFWGFYLLQGSTVTVSSCSRRAGASLIIIKGHHHMRQCAYIGDDSSEEAEELEELKKLMDEKSEHNSIPKLMQRARPEVKFHDEKGKVGDEYLLRSELDLKDHADEFDASLLEEHRAKTKAKETKKQDEVINTITSEELIKAFLLKVESYKTQGKDFFKGLDNKKFGSETDFSKLRKTVENNKLNDNVVGTEKVDLMDEEKRRSLSLTDLLKVKSPETDRVKRHIEVIHEIRDQLNKHDEEANNAEEQGVELQEVRGSINGTTANDTSNSEFWSSFSSSEERLLECEGLILSQPLIPSSDCHHTSSDHQFENAFKSQRISYTVPGNGYYFFIFGSENEIQENYVRTHFQLEKMLYNVSNPVESCENSTGQCSLPLNFFSHERLVLELPVNDSLWNNEFLVKSTCEPRTAIYIACIIAVPVLILLCAF